MKINEVVGIDVSKLTLDCLLHKTQEHKIFDNTPEGIAELIQWSLSGREKVEILYVFEHTGLYSCQLTKSLSLSGCLFYIAPGLEIKRSLGITRGKEDKADAKKIALYGYRLREEITPTQLCGDTLESIKRLDSLRKKLVRERAGHKTTLKEQERVLDRNQNRVLLDIRKDIISMLNQRISEAEKEIDRLMAEDPKLVEVEKLLISIKGMGKVTARFLIIYTGGFTLFDTWRQFASYCGTAPFPNQSGTSIMGKTKVSHLANKDGKTLLEMCARSAIQCNPEMKQYYERRVEEGKNKTSTLNIIRNKLLARAFAVVQRGTPYVDIMRYAA